MTTIVLLPGYVNASVTPRETFRGERVAQGPADARGRASGRGRGTDPPRRRRRALRGEAGLFYRDIKSANILLSGRHAFVADVGIAKAISEARAEEQLTTGGAYFR